MPGYKKRYYKRKKRPTRRAARPNLYKAINTVLNKELETKYWDRTISNIVANTSVLLQSGLSQGTDNDDFMGRSISVNSIQIRGSIYSGDVSNNTIVRIMLVQWFDEDATFDISRILQFTTSTSVTESPYRFDESGVFRVMLDKRFQLGANITANINRTKLISIVRKYKKPIKTDYNESGYWSPALYFFMCTDHSANYPSFDLYTRITFKDA